MKLTRKDLVSGLPLQFTGSFISLESSKSDLLELSLDYGGEQVSVPVTDKWPISMTTTRDSLLSCVPLDLGVDVHTIFVQGPLLWVSGSCGSISVNIPMTKDSVANLISGVKQYSTAPGEEVPEYKSKSTSSTGSKREGPRVGSTKTVNGVTKKLVKYDFVTPRLKGRRRVTCPDTGKRGFPVWERI